ncbi:MAG: hypothetical protein JWR64_1619, partial [Marmoricola sp.]|nr:hypothetical protein [Marmoricola sp.]
MAEGQTSRSHSEEPVEATRAFWEDLGLPGL